MRVLSVTKKKSATTDRIIKVQELKFIKLMQRHLLSRDLLILASAPPMNLTKSAPHRKTKASRAIGANGQNAVTFRLSKSRLILIRV